MLQINNHIAFKSKGYPAMDYTSYGAGYAVS